MNESVALQAVKEVLGKLRPERVDLRNDWLTVGMALHKVLKASDEGLTLWVEWSQQSDKFVRGECERLWESFQSDKERTVNLGTLRLWAKEDGRRADAILPTPDKKENPDYIPLLSRQVKDLSDKLKVGFGVPRVKVGKTLDELIASFAYVSNSKEIARWFYQDTAGTDILCIARFQEANGKKKYGQFTRLGDKWTTGGLEENCLLYRLDSILKSDADVPVFVAEGEKAADAVVSLGYVCTTSCGGANSPQKTDWSILAGRRVVLLPDNDAAGLQYTNKVSRILCALHPPALVSSLRLPSLPEKGDAWDFVQNTDRPREVLAGLLDANAPQPRHELVGGPVVVNMDSVEVKEVDWLWKNRIPMGRITLIVGRQGEGKTFLTSGDIASRVTLGGTWPDRTPCCRGKVLLITAEDSASDTLKPRLLAHGADVSQILSLSIVRKMRTDGTFEERGFELTDVNELRDAVEGLGPDLKLIVIDPIGSFMGAETDAFRDNEVRAVLAPVAKIAEEKNCAVIIVAHRRKDGGNNADDLTMGSRAFTALARVVLHVCRDADDIERRLLLPGKNNLAKEGNGFAFRIEGNPTRIVWETADVKLTANESVRREQAIERNRGNEEIDDWLYHELTGSPRTVDDMRQEAKNAGLTWSAVMRAANTIKVKKTKTGGDGKWYWSLPEGDK